MFGLIKDRRLFMYNYSAICTRARASGELAGKWTERQPGRSWDTHTYKQCIPLSVTHRHQQHRTQCAFVGTMPQQWLRSAEQIFSLEWRIFNLKESKNYPWNKGAIENEQSCTQIVMIPKIKVRNRRSETPLLPRLLSFLQLNKILHKFHRILCLSFPLPILLMLLVLMFGGLIKEQCSKSSVLDD